MRDVVVDGWPLFLGATLLSHLPLSHTDTHAHFSISFSFFFLNKKQSCTNFEVLGKDIAMISISRAKDSSASCQGYYSQKKTIIFNAQADLVCWYILKL